MDRAQDCNLSPTNPELLSEEITAMRISLIVCTYNRCQSLGEILERIAVQVVPDDIAWEVIVVDNNSTDATREVVEEVSRRFPGRFRYVFEKQQGLSFARNAGIKESRSDVVAFTDDDVTFEPNWLWNLTSNLLSGEWAGAGGRITPIWAKPLPKWMSVDDPHTMGPFALFDQGEQPGQLNRPPYGGNMAFHRTTFEKFGVFRTELGRSRDSLHGGEDTEFGGRLLAAGARLRYEPKAEVFHPASESRMSKKFVLYWWFWFGYGEVVQLGRPSSGRWTLMGIPLNLYPRILRWTLQWFVTLDPARRFACRRSVWYIAGTIFACYRWRQICEARMAFDTK